MKKIIFLIALVLLVSGCDEEVVEDGPFVGGTNGLTIDFADGAPLSEFSSTDSVPVKVTLKNDGEYDLPENSAEVALYGLAMSDFGLSADYVQVSQGILGIKKDFIEEGGLTTVDMGTISYQGEIPNYINPTLRAKVCYPYQTESGITVCASSREIDETGGESVCSISGEKYTATRVSSSPVTITSFTEELRETDKVKFVIEVENKGLGEPYADDYDCSELDAAIKADQRGKVHFRVVPDDVTCVSYDGSEGSEGYIKLDQGARTLICSMPVENTGSSYTREVKVFLDFKYTQSIPKPLTILEA
jgi:hypothetical protein